ncbi:MAG: lipoprotein [Woeseia sp.]
MKPIRRISLFLMSVLLLAACGQKGPLYLPGNPTAVRSDVPSTNASTVPEEEEEEEAKAAEDEPQQP